MEDTHDPTPNTSPAAETAEAIEIYAGYWTDHIAPLKDGKIKAQFSTILIDVFGRLYGEREAMDLIARLINIDLDLRG